MILLEDYAFYSKTEWIAYLQFKDCYYPGTGPVLLHFYKSVCVCVKVCMCESVCESVFFSVKKKVTVKDARGRKHYGQVIDRAFASSEKD